MVCITREDANLLVVSEHGYGKRSLTDDYRITKRGGIGVKTINITDKTGKLVAIKEVVDEDELMIINRSGITIRIKVSELRVMGRATQGVRLIKLNEDDRISSVEKIQQIVEVKSDSSDTASIIASTEDGSNTIIPDAIDLPDDDASDVDSNDTDENNNPQ
jgi:DNA gyrase subunit A